MFSCALQARLFGAVIGATSAFYHQAITPNGLCTLYNPVSTGVDTIVVLGLFLFMKQDAVAYGISI